MNICEQCNTNKVTNDRGHTHGWCTSCYDDYVTKISMQNHKRIKNDVSTKEHEHYLKQRRANSQVYRAKNLGFLPEITTQKCSICGKNAEDYHHPDYEKPLSVAPLCKSCHNRQHPH